MKFNVPNILTLLRILMIPVFMLVLGLGGTDGRALIAATAIFAAASATDLLDGYIARKRNLITNFGKFADPLADKLLVSAALVAMVELERIPGWIAVLIIAREFIVTGLRLVAVNQNVVIAAGIWGKLKTASQMLMVIFVLPGFTYTPLRMAGLFLIMLSAALTVVSMADYLVKYAFVLKE
ncbi:MAG: CDP-diacylglycerol--glycerol-3-phosphate 3-phosphatidyltransferase [Clostridiales bacterium]|nr:CDP-diacylglycerol--glycerol-3-phosphate 3-phosphatidyltransferase [Clostridiales bacterium]